VKATPALSLITGGATAGTDTHVSTDPTRRAVATLIAALEDAWNSIRAHHPQIPPAVVIVGPGTGTGLPAEWGHYSTLRWQHTDSKTDYSEVMVAGEALSENVREVLGTLLHEAAHALADTLSIKDTSRQGRWHNKHFARLATDLGLTATKDAANGYTTSLPDLTAERYASTLIALSSAITVFRHPVAAKPKKKRENSNNPIPIECACPRKIRVAPTVLETGPITCDVCEHQFTAEGQEEPSMDLYDPTGEHHNGLPTYPYRMAPKELATRRQLAALNLRPGGQDIAAQILWRRGKRVAYLYRIELAKPKRQSTPAQLAALERANLARHTCSTCKQVKTYTIPTRYDECLDCAGVTPS
jgi:hypothetical protein